MEREGFDAMLAYMLGNGARIVLVENASRFARDLVVQITGHSLLKKHGLELIAQRSRQSRSRRYPR